MLIVFSLASVYLLPKCFIICGSQIKFLTEGMMNVGGHGYTYIIMYDLENLKGYLEDICTALRLSTRGQRADYPSSMLLLNSTSHYYDVSSHNYLQNPGSFKFSKRVYLSV